MSRWLAFGFIVIAVVSCRGGASPFELAQQRVDDGVGHGLEASSAQGPVTLDVRYNPAPCDCPPYEVFTYGRWARAFLDVEQAAPALDALRTGDPLTVTKINGRVDDDRRAAANGVEYPVVSVL